MTAITRDYFCDSCRRTHRITSLVGRGHKTYNELVLVSAAHLALGDSRPITPDRPAPRRADESDLTGGFWGAAASRDVVHRSGEAPDAFSRLRASPGGRPTDSSVPPGRASAELGRPLGVRRRSSASPAGQD